MAVFGRRQLQVMLNELAPWLTASKGKDLLGRIESDDPDQAIPGEYELALSWAVSKTAHLEVDRQAGSRRPDIFSRDLVSAGPIAIEMTAMSDDPLSRKPLMRRAANIINQEANKTKRSAHKHLYFTFMEESGHLPANRHSNGFTRYFRRPCITRHFKMSSQLSLMLKSWLSNAPEKNTLRLKDENIDVLIDWKDYVHRMSNTFCSMPAVTYDVRDNPLYDLLKAKAKQLRDVPKGTLRGIFLGDAGCSLLRDIRPIGAGREVTGDQIIRRFLERNPVDLIAVFVPRRANENAMWNHDNPRLWHVYIYTREITDETCVARIVAMRDHLPNPYLHGYQARSWLQQGMTKPQAGGHYLGSKWTGGIGRMKVHISARGLQEFMAGRLTIDQLRSFVVGENNPFEMNLSRGRTIAAVAFVPKGIESDDDYIVFEFDDDPAASPLSLPDRHTA